MNIMYRFEYTKYANSFQIGKLIPSDIKLYTIWYYFILNVIIIMYNISIYIHIYIYIYI